MTSRLVRSAGRLARENTPLLAQASSQNWLGKAHGSSSGSMFNSLAPFKNNTNRS